MVIMSNIDGLVVIVVGNGMHPEFAPKRFVYHKLIELIHKPHTIIIQVHYTLSSSI
jgi:hypothetical protein